MIRYYTANFNNWNKGINNTIRDKKSLIHGYPLYL